MVVKCCEVFPIESIVRGYLTGSAWASYQKTGEIHGIELPQGLRESEKLEEPLWTPSTKAEKGAKDENIHPAKGRSQIRKIQFWVKADYNYNSQTADWCLECP